MSTRTHVQLSIEGETSIEFPSEGVTTTAIVTKVGADLYRLDSVPVMIEAAKFGDVIEAEDVGSKALRFGRVVEKSNWRVFDFMLSRDAVDSERMNSVLRRVEEVGGHWERVFGGCLFICLPPEVDWNPTAEVVG